MISRRDFLKFSAITGLAAVIPFNIVMDNRDDETKMLDYIMTKYDDEIVVIGLIKEYGIIASNGKITQFFNGFATRQPNVIAWLKERIKPTYDINGKRTTNNPRYNKSRVHQYTDEQIALKTRLWVEIGTKFNLPIERVKS